MRPRILTADAAGIAEASALLRSGRLVAFPTETVYGLGVHALDAAAVRRLFEAKGRPSDDPLIVHIADVDRLPRLAVPSSAALLLAERFWPGPLTLVLPRLAHVPDETTAGLATVGVRVPSHPVARALLRAADVPIAAPSANLFGRPSPTRAEHVLEDLAERIDAVVDGGPTDVGVESTIVDLSGPSPRLLRAGGLPTEDIEAALGTRLLVPERSARPIAPGMLPSHYAPRTPLVLITGRPPLSRARLRQEVEQALASGQRVGVLLLDEDSDLPATATAPLGAYTDPTTTAVHLFDALRSLDRQDLDVIFARQLADPHAGLGQALADRMRRAASRVIEG
jgi:L-threonylcarbamoyladenylate synthase